MRRLGVVLVAVGVVIATMCVARCTERPTEPVTPPPVSTEADEAAVEELAAAWVTAAESGDVEAMLAMYTADAVRMPPDAPAYSGLDAIEEYYREIFSQISAEVIWPFGDPEIIVCGDWAVHISRYSIRVTPLDGGDSVEEVGKVVEIFQRQRDGSWLIAREIWNRDAPQ